MTRYTDTRAGASGFPERARGGLQEDDAPGQEMNCRH